MDRFAQIVAKATSIRIGVPVKAGIGDQDERHQITIDVEGLRGFKALAAMTTIAMTVMGAGRHRCASL
jgi:hypothetical protein